MVFLLTALFFALRSSKVQTYIAQKLTNVISEKVGLPIHISHLEIEFFNTLKIEDLYIEDLNKDTLFYVQNIDAGFSYFSLFQKKILLNQLEIKHVYVDINRLYEDSLFNIDHLELSSFGSAAASEEKTSSSSSWDLQLEDLVLKDLRFKYEDYYAGFVLNSQLQELQISCRYFKLGDNQIELQQSILKQADVNILQIPANPTYIKKEKSFESIYLPFFIENSTLLIENSCFSFNNSRAEQSSKTKFDSKHITLNQINGRIENVLFAYDSLYADLQRLNFTENSGLNIEQIQGNFSFANQEILLQNLNLNTSNSSLSANVSLSYNSFLAFNNFIEDVRFDLNILEAKIDAKEIAYFVANNKINWNNQILIDGHFYGTVSSFKSKDLHIKTGRNSIFEGEFSMNGLPKIKETFISGKVNRLHTDFSDIIRFYPSLALPENLRKLGILDFKGNFDGFLNDFVTYGRLKTDLGIAQTDLNFKLDKENNAYYSGNFALEDFDIGRYFAKEDIFGKVSLSGSAKGKGIKLNTLDLEIDALIEKVEIKNYSYNQVQINGHLKDKFFEGHLDIDDENLGLIFDGTIDASQTKPSFKFEANMKRFNPKALNLWNKEMNLKSEISADFTASTIDDLIGKVQVKDLIVNTEDKTYDLGDIVLESSVLVNAEKRIKLITEDFDAEVEGSFNWLKVPNAIKSVLIPNFKDNSTNQLMRFELNIRKNPAILALFVPKLSILKPSIIEGNFNSNTQSMLARMDVPLIQYQDFSVFNLSTNIYVNQGNVDMINSVPLVYYKDSVLLQDLAFLVNGPRNNLDLKLYTDGAENTSIELLANMITKNKRVKFVFEPSNIFINKQFWIIDENNEITIGERVQSKNLKLYNGISELLIDLDLGSKDQKADVYLSNIFIQDFTQFLAAKNIDLKGIVNGRLGMEISEGNPGFFGNLLVENIEVNAYKVGNLNANASLDLANKQVKINANLYGDDNEVDINGTYSIDSKSTPKDIDLRFDVKNFAIYSIEEFIAQYIDNVQGTVSGKLTLSGPRAKPDLLGYLDINDVTTTVTFLQTTYNIKQHRVTFEKNAINLGNNIRITDMDGNEAFGKGKILHKNLKGIALDIDVWSDKIIGLNTKYGDNDNFYGKAYLDGGVSFKGPVNDIVINVAGESEAKSEVFIPLSEGSTASDYKFYTFKEKEKSEEEKFLTQITKDLKVNGLTVNLDLDLDNDCKLSIILDEAAGDVLEVKGEGNVKITVPKEGDVQFYGAYVINDGDYLFTLQNIINKRFRIEPNSSIVFQGRIEDTRVDVDAVYDLRAAPKALIEDYLQSGADEEVSSEASNRVPVKLLLKMRNRLYNPDISFEIQVSQLNPKLRNYVDRKMLTLGQYENEMNRQVFGLLVLNQFLPPLSTLDQISNGININANDAANTVSEFLSNQLTRYFNDWLSYFSDDVSFNFNYRNYEQDASPVSSVQDLALRRELQLALTTQLLNDRVTINLGGNVDFGANQLGTQTSTSSNNTTYFGGNFSIEYALTENRRFRIKAFTNTNYDYFNQGNSTRAGVGLSFKREFDKISEFKIDKEEFRVKDAKNDSIKKQEKTVEP